MGNVGWNWLEWGERELSGEMAMFYILIGIWIAQVYVFAKAQQMYT